MSCSINRQHLCQKSFIQGAFLSLILRDQKQSTKECATLRLEPIQKLGRPQPFHGPAATENRCSILVYCLICTVFPFFLAGKQGAAVKIRVLFRRMK